MKHILLNLGCGQKTHPDWINVDISSRDPNVIQCDMREGLPFKDHYADMVYHSHVLEHLTPEEGEDFIRECHRILKPGGIIRICVPDLENIARNYIATIDAADGLPENEANHAWMIMELVDQMVRNVPGGMMKKYLIQKNIPNESFVYGRVGDEARNIRKSYLQPPSNRPTRAHVSITSIIRKLFKFFIPRNTLKYYSIGKFRMQGEIHQWMYDRISLTSLLAKQGFTDIEIMRAATSKFPRWESFTLDTNKDGNTRKPDSLFLEAKK